MKELEGRHILLLEDDNTARMAMEHVFTSNGCTVHLASSYQQALDVFRQHADKIEMILLDIELGDDAHNGFDVIREIRTNKVYEKYKSVPFVVCTAYADLKIVQSGFELMTAGYIFKSNDFNQLLIQTINAFHTAQEQQKQRVYLENRKKMNQVVGLLAERYRISFDKAYQNLRSIARKQGIKIDSIVDDLVSDHEKTTISSTFNSEMINLLISD